ncbi:MAG: terminase TerL endonuclease subunit [Planctomycetota bacterium]
MGRPIAHDHKLFELEALLADGRSRSRVEIACLERMRRDFETGHERDLFWDEQQANRIVTFASACKHWKGALAGSRFRPEPWQKLCVFEPIWAWYEGGTRKQGGRRRFRIVYIQIPRKNGKTFVAAIIGDSLLLLDGESGAEVYVIATGRSQADIAYQDCCNILPEKPAGAIEAGKEALQFHPLKATLKALPYSPKRLDGLNVHGVINDEFHEHPDRRMYDVVKSGMQARRNPLLLSITTAGFNRAGICYEQLELALRVMRGEQPGHDYLHAFITTIDDGDDWRDPATWAKANPNLGVSKDEKNLAIECEAAQVSAAAENEFRCKHLNQWVAQQVRWIQIDRWDDSRGPRSTETLRDALKGRRCFGGLDLASTQDLAAFSLVFPPDNEADPWHVLAWYWCPGDVAKRTDSRGFLGWVPEWIKPCPGAVIDYATIRADLHRLKTEYDIRGVAFDKWNFEAERQQLIKEGWPEAELIQFGQSVSNYNEPMRRLLDLVAEERFRHGGDPVLRFCFENVTARTDHNGNTKPDKGKSAEKIDGACAALMALGLALHPDFDAPAPDLSFYLDNDLEEA